VRCWALRGHACCRHVAHGVHVWGAKHWRSCRKICSTDLSNDNDFFQEGPPGGRRQTHSPVKTKGSRPPHRSDPCPEPLSSWHPVPPKQWVKKDGVWLENGEQEAQGHKGEQEAQGHKTMPVTKPLSPGAVRAQSTLSFLVEYRGEE
jgi:hypothetical protein